MVIKENLKRYIQEHLKKSASPLFIERTFNVIDASPNDKESLLKASTRIGNMILLFIDRKLAKEVFENLKTIIEDSNK